MVYDTSELKISKNIRLKGYAKHQLFIRYKFIKALYTTIYVKVLFFNSLWQYFV